MNDSVGVATGNEIGVAATRRHAFADGVRGSYPCLLLIWDVLVTLAVLLATAQLAGGPFTDDRSAAPTHAFTAPALMLAALAPCAIAIAGGYSLRRPRVPSVLAPFGPFAVGSIACAWTVSVVAVAAGWPLHLAQLAVASAVLPFAWLAARGAAGAHANRRHPERVLLLGSGKAAYQISTLTERHRERGLKVVGRLDDSSPPLESDAATLLGGLDDLERVLINHKIDRVIVAFSPRSDEQIVEILRRCDQHRVNIDVVPRLFDLLGPRPCRCSLGRFPLIGVTGRRPSLLQRALKRAIDVCVSALLLALAAPVLAVAAIAIALDDGRPVVFAQERVGRGGRIFRIFKLRTMRPDSERLERVQFATEMAEHVAALKARGGERITRVGRLLRRTSMDELPQLWNVLAGDMSLVGPRPLPLAEMLPADVGGWQRLRQEVRPGITGLWQVLGRSDVGWEERMQLDYTYVRHWTVANDLRILARTLPAVARARGAV